VPDRLTIIGKENHLSNESGEKRIEEDALGKRSLDNRLYYGIQTSRAVDNFAISGKSIADIPGFVESIIHIKQAAAKANFEAGGLQQSVSDAIVKACEHWLGRHAPDQFVVDVYHGGGGTAANMNVNEVLANWANEFITGKKGYAAVHPNTHVNMGQSTNDVIPSAMKLAMFRLLAEVRVALRGLIEVIYKKEVEFSDVVKIGRTCFQDALPITLGQMFSGYRHCFERAARELETVQRACLTLPLGATAIGTEFGLLPGYKRVIYRELRAMTDIPIVEDENFFDGLQNADSWIGVSGALKSTALSLSKMSADLRLMSSGPRSGLAEIVLPAVQPGSSIMPGKINPVIPEMIMQVYFRILGNDATISRACEGELDLNVWETIILNALSESASLLSAAIPKFVSHCINGIVANSESCFMFAEQSLSLSAAIARIFDYPLAGSVARVAAENNVLVKDAAVQMGLLSKDEAAEVFDVKTLADPSKSQSVMNKYRILRAGRVPAGDGELSRAPLR
jgi:aspartate ammonia-lyase